jgi:two-component system sensor histidine kinase PilS (NtrC family)
VGCRPTRFPMTSLFANPSVKSAWLLPLRLITFCLISGVVVAWLRLPSFLQAPFLAYCLITLTMLVTLLLFRRVRLHFLYRFLIALQFSVEILIEVGIVYTTGSLYSPFSALFLLTIVSAALVYRLVGTLLVASLVSVAYAGVSWVNAALLGGSGQILPSVSDSLFSKDDIVFYSTFLHILIFYLVAFVSGYLAEKLQSKDQALHSASTELKRARLETGDILRHLNCGLITIDTSGDIVYFNRTAELILGLKESEVSGRHCRSVFGGRLENLADNLMSVLESREWFTRSELDVVDNSGVRIPLGISTSVLYDEDFGVRGVIAIFQDLTEIKRLEEKMRQADRMAAIGELSACIAHEIRNPLASISGSVEVLKNEVPLDGDNESLMSLIVKETGRLNNILSDFLLYARIGRSQLRKVDLQRVISDVIELIRRHPAYNDSIRIDLRAANHVTYISGDEDQVKQLLLNLAVNACEALEGGPGRVEFEIPEQPEEGTIMLIVRDTGPGIPRNELDRIFLPFHSTKKSGTGLGLSIVSRLMEAMDGRIDVVSRPGEGAEFHLIFHGLREKAVSRDAGAISVS